MEIPSPRLTWCLLVWGEEFTAQKQLVWVKNGGKEGTSKQGYIVIHVQMLNSQHPLLAVSVITAPVPSVVNERGVLELLLKLG